MIIELPDTTVSQINRRLVTVREQGGAVALSRVLTLVIDAGDCDIEPAIEAANAASHEHPCRVIVLSHEPDTDGKLNAELRLGRDAGASEVIVLRHSEELSQHLDTLVLPLLLPDAPVVIYWPHEAPTDPSEDPVGKLGQRRITDSRSDPRGIDLLLTLRDAYVPGDTDLAWTRTTLWRSRIAATLDQPPFEPVLRATVAGEEGHPSIDLLAGWLALRLECPVDMELIKGVPGLTEVRLERASGTIVLSRPDGNVASFNLPGQPAQRISLPMRSLGDALAEDLRRLDSDEVYGDVLREGLSLVEGR
ncbi:glucose-6-phosphate dehydrogenase assembly protein OpcA [Actinomycetaceae bacterium MB13-C1-2]|nr:glucose-6-phosphate dehydrogenase assembly protein OpcA [Actinomycetaceae bacterium MB13-C1-2]